MKITKAISALTASLILFANANAQFNPPPTSPQAVTITFNASSQTPYLSTSTYVSGVISDPTDPAAIIGLTFDIKENGSAINAADYTITATSSKTSVVTVANVVITKSNGSANVKIIPTGTGYSDIKLTLTKSSSSANITINYAASAASSTPSSTFWHTGFSDASAAFALDNDYMVVCDDEINSLFVVNRKQSGLPVKTYDYQNLLGLTDGSSGNYKEVDVEAGVKSITYPNRIYWMSSLGDGHAKPNINRIFATTITGTGASTTFAMAGYYNDIRSKLITWGNTNGYNFTASAADGKEPKAIDGFNVEGMCIGPDNTTLYIAFRAPLVPTASRSKALIAPVLNFETWFNNGSPSTAPTFGTPIELNLGGRGFRDIVRLSNGTYIIIAGNYLASPLTGAIFKWSGNAADAPVQISTMDISTLNAEAVVEINEGGSLATNKLEIISDNGSTEFYKSGEQAKDLDNLELRKFRVDIITAPSNVLPVQFEYFNAAKQNNNSVLLDWKIGSSSDANHFEVERSVDGTQFASINSITANSSLNYSFQDNSVPSNIVYYRIKAFDKTGSFYYSSIKTINSSNNSAVKIYPNPVTNNIFTVSTQITVNKILQIFNSKGQLYKQFGFPGKNLQVDAANWPKGAYFFTIIAENSVFSHGTLAVL
jgi:hypothetical protein